MSQQPIRVPLTPNFRNAGLFLMAHWPRAETAPQLITSDGPLLIELEPTPEGIADLQSALCKVKEHGGELARSANAWSQLVERTVPTA